MGGVWGGGAPPKKGVRALLDNAADRAMGSRHAEAAYVASVLVTGAVSAVLMWVGRRLSR